ncbi:hypothetical protein CTI12_AA505160 [Artemisia annua]|uniref:OTU domain-containing protein n=1 Tax=Artemisia annua TaxID=35608 RepID=A0A2U1LCU0_ARTAN|nr:hypothetical protein CTI12_AA505160 [Artemisia annua]
MLLQRLKEYKYVRRQVRDDGNCFFRAVSHQLFNTEDYHMFIRAVAMAYMRLHHQDFYDPREGSFEGFWNYTYKMSQCGEYAGEDMIKATCESFRLKIVRLFSFHERCIEELIPRFDRPKKVIHLSFIPSHSDSMFRVGTMPAEPLPTLTTTRINQMKQNGTYTLADLGRNRWLGRDRSSY